MKAALRASSCAGMTAEGVTSTTWLSTLPSKRRGVGKALVEAALAALSAQGITRAKLDAFKDNEEGNAFWEAMGFFHRSDLYYWNKSLNDENV